jgi:hypothetical protein
MPDRLRAAYLRVRAPYLKAPASADASEATRDGRPAAMRGSADGTSHAAWESLDVC